MIVTGELGAMSYCSLGVIDCGDTLAAIKATRAFDESLFLTENEFDADPQHKGVNPRPGRNLLERIDTAFVDLALRKPLAELLGAYQILDHKLVCGVPRLPSWVAKRIAGNPVNNLGAYVRPEYRDVTYFSGIDFHQDIIDYPSREADFVTVYVYLTEVSEDDAPLRLLEASHRLGATVFPHDLEHVSGDDWRYRDDGVQMMRTREVTLTGPAGSTFLWHACTLHGTTPVISKSPRFSLRYLFAKTGKRAGIDLVNDTISGRLSLAETRRDLDARGVALVKMAH